MVRCFIGFALPENIKKHVSELQKEVVKLPLEYKLVEVENLHVCLSFLGEVKEDELGRINEGLDEVCRNYVKFNVETSEVKAIPNESYIRVLALDILEKTGSIERIRKEIVQKIGGDSKPPHITLCRVKNVSDKKTVALKLEEMKGRTESFPVVAIQLIKSELRRTGPIYSVIHESKLGD